MVPIFFWPQNTICHYKLCNTKHSGVIGYGLEEAYCFVTGIDCLDGAHSSIVDAHAQSVVVDHEFFQPFWDRPVGIVD